MRASYRLFAQPPLIRLSNASFYRTNLSPNSDPSTALFPNVSIELPSDASPGESWGVVGASGSVRTDFLRILRGSFICHPPNARTYPYLSTNAVKGKLRLPANAIQYVGFDADRGVASLRGSYLSQRYESKREISDFSLRDFLTGHTELNADDDAIVEPSTEALGQVVTDLKLERLLDMPVSHLSNGQTRRSRIAKALLASPEVLMLDSPFSMSIDHVCENFG